MAKDLVVGFLGRLGNGQIHFVRFDVCANNKIAANPIVRISTMVLKLITRDADGACGIRMFCVETDPMTFDPFAWFRGVSAADSHQQQAHCYREQFDEASRLHLHSDFWVNRVPLR